MTNYQKKQNEEWILKMIKISNKYLWLDKQELYHFIDGKILPKTKRGYLEMKKIVSNSFSNKYLIKIN